SSEVVTPISGRMSTMIGTNPADHTACRSRMPGRRFATRAASYPQTEMSSQYIFTMYKVSRVHPPDKTVLRDVSLSFYPGAKIGVLGLNGTGKSTLLRIMAGVDTEYRGEAQL